jgi:hypothetical protein
MTKIYITEDGNRIEATGEVLQQLLDTQAELLAVKQAKEAEDAAKLAAKEAVLAKLGLTAEEAAALLA